MSSRIDIWDDTGGSIVEHVAGVDDFEVAEATWLAAVKRWPKAPLFCVKVRESCMTAADPE